MEHKKSYYVKKEFERKNKKLEIRVEEKLYEAIVILAKQENKEVSETCRELLKKGVNYV